MAAGGMDDDEEIVGINVTPLVDIILVLLVIFMVTTTTIQSTEGLEVDKPDASEGKTLDEVPVSILMTCHKDGRIMVDGKEIKGGDEEIEGKIKAKVEQNPDLQAIISCDEESSVGTMVHLIDLLKQNKVRKYAIATEKPPVKEG